MICWNCDAKFAAGNSWGKVRCPNCKKVNDLPVEKNKVSDWERFLELKHIKVTCPNCARTIYVQRGSEHVVCSGCETILSIVKEVPLRPGAVQHHFCHSVLVPKESDFKHHTEYLPPKSITSYDKFKPLLQTVKNNEFNIKSMTQYK